MNGPLKLPLALLLMWELEVREAQDFGGEGCWQGDKLIYFYFKRQKRTPTRKTKSLKAKLPPTAPYSASEGLTALTEGSERQDRLERAPRDTGPTLTRGVGAVLSTHIQKRG